MCCSSYVPGDEEDRSLGLVCEDCGEPVDRNGESLNDCCSYSPVNCYRCHDQGCDQSC